MAHDPPKSKSQLVRERKFIPSTPLLKREAISSHSNKKKDKEKHYARFLELFNQLNIIIPFLEALEQMTVYSEYMKDLLTMKMSIRDESMGTLKAGYSAIIHKSLSIGNAFLDLGASINLMPLSMLERIRNVEVNETYITVQLADCSIRIPHGVVENMLVDVGKFTLSTDFVIMDIEEDSNIPLILGKPFLNTINVVISVAKGKFTI